MRLLWLIPAVFMIGNLAGCEKLETRHKKTVEERLLDSFSDSSEELRERVGRVVVAAEKKDYEFAMNELALISATRQLEKPQKKAVDDLMRQLRYDMEEEELGDKLNE
ncbi:hypothetical protein [Emcibacter sp.]|uniref:hypothetical protein n=1 Tax=Emcibacter sp. TaxID=1979954 RepID=UPI002AA6E232|nr:hypothetical protein [Emcibacter sp.]